MKKTFYEKRGRRYVPVYEYDQTLMDALPKGSHLIQVYPGGKSTRYNVDPNYAAMIAAGRVAGDAISKELMRAWDLRPTSSPITSEQKQAWESLIKELGDSARQLEWPSIREAVDAGLKAMQDEALVLLNTPAVRAAWDQFMLIAALSKEQDNG